jgi:hypothetical protein
MKTHGQNARFRMPFTWVSISTPVKHTANAVAIASSSDKVLATPFHLRAQRRRSQFPKHVESKPESIPASSNGDAIGIDCSAELGSVVFRSRCRGSQTSVYVGVHEGKATHAVAPPSPCYRRGKPPPPPLPAPPLRPAADKSAGVMVAVAQ